jgi:hypothetical protein
MLMYKMRYITVYVVRLEMPEKKDQLISIVGTENVIDDPEILDAYSRDNSFTPPMKPRLVVKPKNTDEVQGRGLRRRRPLELRR